MKTYCLLGLKSVASIDNLNIFMQIFSKEKECSIKTQFKKVINWPKIETKASYANQKLKELADKKISAASLQNAINDTAEEYGLIADDLAKGKVKIDKKAAKEAAKFGKEIEKAQFGFFGPIMAPMFGVSKATQIKLYSIFTI